MQLVFIGEKNELRPLTPAETLNIEELEQNMKTLQAELHEARSRNLYLTELVEKQRRFSILS